MPNQLSRSHRRLARFVDWIKPAPETRQIIIRQSADIRAAIKGQAEADGLTVLSTPESGSFAKHTGLRRHRRGGIEIEGQDVDLPFVVKPATEEGERIGDLLKRFDRYAENSYPNTPRKITGCSVELGFVTTKLNYDLVPMLRSQHSDYQVILKKDGGRRLTSVQKHTAFVRGRTAASEQIAGAVAFNECVRLMKWWRDVRLGESGSIDEVRTFLIELLCAAAFDRFKVAPTYTATLMQWFGWMAHLAETRARVKFSDYASIESFDESSQKNRLWYVLDPVNENNNVVHSQWTNLHLSEFAEWLAHGRDTLSRIDRFEKDGRYGDADKLLAELFGNAVIDHGDIS